ncbi:DNA replication ATP-dependent helicase dna2 [Verticillium dahliae VdLs.17]|uniref:DNA replication ATP-dependent helicase/nuclease n=1 Tax=Verticillium dahliae (strain VdLs.17 / ATCC MYA-4575 / FGSC 10137) TaxID=498257 RepID=G2WST7_VERDV|nr:DNA replication ATP-dependent helicase dna2 [Verticillium dahliae VdLs.17]EGY17951.1 DNA replication ATP-dependent helicase dna2 [Verticillium dahliae VdLs.17]KAF3342739.1 Putative uncharacterized oxidoreductase [Verticillium dahliae VDG2]
MPLPQRSHSAYEQNRFAKSRAQWQRAKTHSATGQTTSNRPLAPVSEKTRNKLTEFQFQPPSDVVDLTSTPPKKDDQQDTCRPPVSQDATSMTPAGRVSLKDLMAREPKPSIEIEHLSPNERIMWNNKEDPAYSSMISPMISRRHRKRARSSSPISSPCTDMAPTPVPAVDVKKLGAALRSPHADPTLELWDRFSLGNRGGLATPLGATNTSLAQFMVSSSPRPPKGAVPSTEAGFRRTLSNGLNWPKRRRFDRPETLGMSARNSQSFGDVSKSSLVTALLDTVESKQEFTSPASATGKDMASESPCPQKRSAAVNGNAHDRTPSSSPYKQERLKHGVAQSQDHAVKQDLGLGIVTQPKPESDYGDDDFLDDDLLDDDTLMQLDLTTTQPSKPASQAPMGPPPSPLKNVHKPVDFLDDDFDDDLDDNIIEAAGLMMDHFEKTNASQAPSQPVRAHHPSPPKLAPAAAKDDPEDEFGDDFGDFDFDAAEMAATQSAKQPTLPLPATQKPKAIQRYLVTNVLESEYLDDHGRTRLEKMLLVQVEKTKIVRTVHLRGDWYETPAHEKSFVHIIGDFDAEGRCVINDDQNMVILHPDQLISATVVADSFTCTRRAVLQDRVKATSEASAPLVYGTMLHEVFQAALLANQWDLKYLSAVIDTIMEKHVEDLYKIKVSTNIAKEHLQSKMPELSSWADMFVASQPKPDAMVSDRNGKKVNMCVSKLLDVEEHVWSPMYGLKGNIDATVQVTMKDGNDTRVLTVPFEVKTGKNANTSHVAQTSLYNLLLTDRYDIEIVYGILYYMESSQTSRIPAIRQELRHMIMQRNQLACHIRERSVQLPPMKKSKHMCNKCYAKTACFIYHRLADNGDDVTSGMGKQFDEVVRHLTPTHQEFFIKWENLLTKEEKESQKLRRELWTMVSKEREKLGRCFSDVVIEEGSWSEDHNSPSINRFRYNFIKREHNGTHSFMESQLAVGEPIVVSDEQGHFALALGYVTSVRKQRICVAVDRRLHNARVRQPGFNEHDNQVFAGIMEVEPEGSTPDQHQGRVRGEPMRYRLDKDEFSNGMAVVRNNLVQIMADDVFGAREIRRLVVDLVPPRFKAAPTQYEIADRASLNVDQQAAIEKVMTAQDYALVLGMPGTGKTTTIAHIIRALVSQGKSVLLTSYTHTAVDNILLKLKDDSIPVLRLGAPAKVHPEVQEFATLAAVPMHSFDEIKSAWHDPPIVATTCLGIGHHVFNERTFDYCIVDEASQITLPICLGPIRMAKTFVLVGDHNQLPPLVQNEEAREGGLDVSLFKLLSDTHPDSVVNLEHQYRMCEDIMTLSNSLIYKGRLRCGTEQLRFTKLDVPSMGALRQRHFDSAHLLQPSAPRSFCTGPAPGRCWIRDLLEPEARVRFINTDTLQPRTHEEAKGNRIVNPGEARVVTQLVESLVAVGVAETEIGVMTHYRSQLALLKHGLRGHPSVEMHTADRFQGRDKEVVVLSLVRSNDACAIGDLLKDWRRINVAFTRAKTKLLVVGSRETLKGAGHDEMLARFIGLMESKAWVYDLPADALESHVSDDAATQASTAAALSPVKARPGFGGPVKEIGGLKGFDKENQRPEPRRAMAGERLLTKNRPITRDILNDMTNGAY